MTSLQSSQSAASLSSASASVGVPGDGVLLRLPMRTPFGLMLLCGALFGGAAAFFFWQARTLDRPLLINGLIELRPFAGSVFFAVLGVLSLGFVVIATLVVLRGLFGAPRVIEVTESELRVPTGRLQSTTTTLPRSTLAAVLTSVHSNVFLLVRSGAQQVSLQKSFFTAADWQTLLDVVGVVAVARDS